MPSNRFKLSDLLVRSCIFVCLSYQSLATHHVPTATNLTSGHHHSSTNTSFTVGSSHSLLSSLPSLPKLNLLNSHRFALPCSSQQSKQRGWCMNSQEQCSNAGLVPDGSCAILKSKLCCVPPVTCGAQVDLLTANGSFIVNPSYPNTTHIPILCEIHLRLPDNKKRSKLSHLKLDIVDLDLAWPSSPTGFCERDALFISGPGYQHLPRMCGRVTGQHLLFNLQRSIDWNQKSIGDHSKTGQTENRDFTLRFVLLHDQWPRKWTFRVWTLEDKHHSLPDHRDCMQQYSKPEDEIKSLNLGDGVSLHGWQYAACIQMRPGYCGLKLESNNFQLKPTGGHVRYGRELNSTSANQTASTDQFNEITVINSNPADLFDPSLVVKSTESSIVESIAASSAQINLNKSQPEVRPLRAYSARPAKPDRAQTLPENDVCRFDDDYVQVPPSLHSRPIHCGFNFNNGKPLITHTAPNMLYISHQGLYYIFEINFNNILRKKCSNRFLSTKLFNAGRQHGKGFSIRYTQLFCQ